jgi:hypothetical protein
VIAWLAVLAFGRGASPPRPVSPRASASARVTATPDARVGEVEAAARRYVQALATAMKTGTPDELDSLSVPGSQAAGNAGASAHIVQGTSRCFVTANVDFKSVSAALAGTVAATASVSYALTGYDADWPSLRQLGSSRTVQATHTLELQLVQGQWLVAIEH